VKMKYTIEMECEQVDAILVQTLKDQYLSLRYDLDLRLANDESLVWGVFDKDKDADCVKIQSHIDAIAKVLSYYMAAEDYKEWKHDEKTKIL